MKQPSADYIAGMKLVMNLIDEAVHVATGPGTPKTERANGCRAGWLHVQKSLGTKLSVLMEKHNAGHDHVLASSDQ